MNYRLKFKYSFLALTWLSLLVLALSFYLEYGSGFQPCPLCLMQRYMVVLLCTTSWLAARWMNFTWIKPTLGLQLFFAIAGLYFSSRQLWLESLPADKISACMPSLDVLIHYFPWKDVAKVMFLGSGDCGKGEWGFLGISLALWSLLYFAFMFVITLWLMFKYKPVLPSD